MAQTLTRLLYAQPTFDEPDNKPKSNCDVCAFRMDMSVDDLRSEEARLRTFDDWPLSFIDKRVLAQTGMYYTKQVDKVKCYFCEVEIGRWEPTDDPVDEHLKWSGNCPLIRRRATVNIPINASALDRILPPVSYDVCGSNDTIEIRHGAYTEGSISSPAPVSNYQIDFPEYAIEAARCRSFAEWPRRMKQTPKELAEAGFFYTGIGDRVKCFSCGGGLKDWDEHDEPWEQHALWLSKCKYLKLMKGESFIEAVLAKHKEQTEKHDVTTNTTTTSTADLEPRESSTQTEVEDQCSNSLTTTATTEETTKTIVSGKDVSTLQRSDSVKSCNSEEKKNIPSEKLCKICYADEYNTAFLPCGHVVACAKCASSVTKCPMCRQPFQDVMRVYFS